MRTALYKAIIYPVGALMALIVIFCWSVNMIVLAPLAAIEWLYQALRQQPRLHRNILHGLGLAIAIAHTTPFLIQHLILLFNP